jgi:hypothetical protein
MRRQKSRFSRSGLLLVLLGKFGAWAARRHRAQAKKLQTRADLYRAAARISNDERVAASYVVHAIDCERLAQEEADLATAYRD